MINGQLAIHGAWAHASSHQDNNTGEVLLLVLCKNQLGQQGLRKRQHANN